MPSERDKTPIGVILITAVLVLYSLFWIVTWILASIGNNPLIAVLSLGIGAGVLGVAYYLYVGNRSAWWFTLALLGGSTLWRISQVASGHADSLSNAIVGALLFILLASQIGFYRPTSA